MFSLNMIYNIIYCIVHPEILYSIIKMLNYINNKLNEAKSKSFALYTLLICVFFIDTNFIGEIYDIHPGLNVYFFCGLYTGALRTAKSDCYLARGATPGFSSLKAEMTCSWLLPIYSMHTTFSFQLLVVMEILC